MNETEEARSGQDGLRLPVLRELIRDEPSWRYTCGTLAGKGFCRLRVWTGGENLRVAVVSESGRGASVTNSAEMIWSALKEDYPGALLLLEHYPASQSMGREHLDMVLVHRGRPEWSAIWPTSVEHPHHAALEAWMRQYGRLIVDGGGTEWE